MGVQLRRTRAFLLGNDLVGFVWSGWRAGGRVWVGVWVGE